MKRISILLGIIFCTIIFIQGETGAQRLHDQVAMKHQQEVAVQANQVENKENEDTVKVSKNVAVTEISESNEEPIVTSKNQSKDNIVLLNHSDRKRIAIVLAGDNQILAEKKIIDEIDKILNQKFPSKQFELVKDKKVYTKLQEYAEDKSITQLDALKKMDFISAGAKYGYDYVIVLPVYFSGWTATTSGWTNILQQNVTLRARIVDVNSAEYLYRMDIVKQGEAGNAFGSPSWVRATKEAIHKSLIEVLSDIDIGNKLEKV
ncbi:hypothetical protein SAMN05660742_10672 [Propionispira arboris]|uniref:Uncharacterized protein n=1 Tax=Propionispira arboris TaxID=84035 RepID=A0A1H6Y3Z8_9FIRM|nr:hypothetical protein [Propionispira arboris]SEJ35166.1 hypothetical protein SAMN05660742_10672 [Propionispira arboris]